MGQNSSNNKPPLNPTFTDLPLRGTNPQGLGRPIPDQSADPILQGSQKQPPKNQSGRGNVRTAQRGRDHVHPGYNYAQYDSQYDTQTNGAYAVNTYNRFDPLLGQPTRDNGSSPRPVAFLGRGKRGAGRGRGRANRPWRGRPQPPYNQNTNQEWWNPPQWQEYHSPIRQTKMQHAEAAELGEGSSRKRPRQTE